MRIDCLSLFPEILGGILSSSILGQAQKKGLLEIKAHSIRQWAQPPHFVTDDRPFGGGAGMVLKPEPLFKGIQALKEDQSHVVYMAPDGEALSTRRVQSLAKKPHLILISGHYEGIDQRVRDQLVDQEISIGDYVLTNGTLAAGVLIDAVARYVPGVLGEEKSLTQDSFQDNLLAFPQYTRPASFQGKDVPEVLLSGNHREIEAWRFAQQLEKTQLRRPDLYQRWQRQTKYNDSLRGKIQ